ncbi:TraB/GumN family protein [Zavarzinia sp. CC-PAN008]|uniref:TraB/GumN family protein n=1 Tax=Zavarzinia sp. CC-PAN008 TaxID=3243332 RepID=UPI003F7445DE
MPRLPMTLLRAFLPLAAALLMLVPAQARQDDLVHGQGRLWQVQRGDAPPSYLFGTMHSADPRVTTLPAPIDKAFKATRTLLLELRAADMGMTAMIGFMVMLDGRTLDNVLGPELYQQTRAVLQTYGLPSVMIDRLSPTGVIAMLSLPPSEIALMRTGAKPLDLDLEQRAEGKSIHALETAQEQIAAFAEIPEAMKIEWIRASVERQQEMGSAYEEMLNLYTKGDLAGIYRLSREISDEVDPALDAHLQKALLVDRNVRMVERMTPYLEKGQAFVAVGAAHMPGDDGILALLERAGWTVTKAF